MNESDEARTASRAVPLVLALLALVVAAFGLWRVYVDLSFATGTWVTVGLLAFVAGGLILSTLGLRGRRP